MALETALDVSNFDDGGADVDEEFATFPKLPAISIKGLKLFSIILLIARSYFSSLPALHKGLQFFSACTVLFKTTRSSFQILP